MLAPVSFVGFWKGGKIEFDYFGETGLTAFRQTGMSVQERYLVRKEKSTDQR